MDKNPALPPPPPPPPQCVHCSEVSLYRDKAKGDADQATYNVWRVMRGIHSEPDI